MSASPPPPTAKEPEVEPTGWLAPGRTVDRYTVEALIGRGGMGEVYRASDGRLRRKVAIKVIRSDRDRPEAVERLIREARAAAALSHPNAVAIHDLGESDGLFFIVMELVDGLPLLAYVGDERTPLARKVRWCAEIAKALASAHKAGVVHRDVKPSNVMINDEGVAKVLDFGLARPIEPNSIDFRTLAGQVLGSIRYMSPEQLETGTTDARSDQYSLGVTAYELLSGSHPGRAPLKGAIPLRELVPELGADCSAVVECLMSTDPNARFPSMGDVVTAFEDIANGRPVRALGVDEDQVLTRPTGPPEIATIRDRNGTASMPPVDGKAVTAFAQTLPSDRPQKPRIKTLLSEQAPPGLEEVVAARDQAVKTAGTRTKSAPPTLASAAAQPQPPGIPPVVTTERMTQRARPAPPVLSVVPQQKPAPAPRSPLKTPLLVLAIVAAGVGTGLIAYFTTRPHASPAPAPPPVLSTTGH